MSTTNKRASVFTSIINLTKLKNQFVEIFFLSYLKHGGSNLVTKLEPFKVWKMRPSWYELRIMFPTKTKTTFPDIGLACLANDDDQV